MGLYIKTKITIELLVEQIKNKNFYNKCIGK